MQRLLFICFFILISQATCGAFWFNIPNPPAVDPNKPMINLKGFVNGFFEYFGIESPSQIIDCFSRDSAELFFEQLQESYDMVTYVNKKYALAIRSEEFKQPLFAEIEPNTLACIALTQDLSNLFHKLGITVRNPKLFSQSNLLYYQAHYDQLLEDFNPVIDFLNDDQFSKAGEAYAKLIGRLVYSVSNEGLGYLAFKGFVNGVALSLGLEDLSFSPKEIDSDTAEHLIWSFQNLESLVFVKNWEEEFTRARHWIEERQDEFKLNQSARAKELIERLGMNVFSTEFYGKFMRYAERHVLNFENQMKLMGDYINHLHMIQAGELFGNWVKQAAAASNF